MNATAPSICPIGYCTLPTFIKSTGLCEPHYRRQRRHGDPVGGGVMRALGPRFRFDQQTSPEPTADGCLLWTGATVTAKRSGMQYGTFKDKDVGWLAHRWLYQHVHNTILLPGEVVRHACDVTLCVNPDHLLRGTQADNIRDCIERGRAWWQQ